MKLFVRPELGLKCDLRQAVLVSGMLLLLVWRTPVQAFQPGIHSEITETALKQITVPLATNTSFSQSAITEIVKGNVDVDDPCGFGGEFCLSAAHCDDESIPACAKRIYEKRDRVLLLLQIPKRDAKEARKVLGQALHTIQDFYSHSNWVNNPGLNNTRINSQLGRDSTLGGIGLERATCRDASVLIDDGLIELTTGYWNHWPNPQAKCSHGPPFFSDSGIHKDKPSRRFHKEAKKLAVDATIDYVRLIIQQLGTDTQAIATLLGAQ